MTPRDVQRNSRVVWFEIPTEDFQRGVRFYETVLHVTLKQEAHGKTQLAIFPYELPAVSGAIVHEPDTRPGANGTVVYLNCDPILAEALQRVVPAGGEIVVPPTQLPEGRGVYAIIRDTEGNKVGLHAMK